MSEITDTQRRALAYWFADGIVEVVGGLAFVLLGGVLYASASSLAPELFSTLVPGMLLLLFPVSVMVVGWLKDRITHPRTGYVKYWEEPGQRRMAVALVGLVVVLGLVAFLTDDYSLGGPVRPIGLTLVGLGMSAALALRAWKMALPRLHAVAVALAGATAWAVISARGFSQGLGIMWVALGTASTVTGVIALSHYLKTHPMPVVEAS